MRSLVVEMIYVIPNRRAATVRRKERSDKVIWETIVDLGDRVGVKVTVHALRRAFAVSFLTSHPGALESLQALDESLADRHHRGLLTSAQS